MKTFKANLIQINSVRSKKPNNTGCFIDVYWFEIELGDGYTTILPYILDFTIESYEAKYEHWFIIQPLQSYSKNSKVMNEIGTECYVNVLMSKKYGPIRIESIQMAKSN